MVFPQAVIDTKRGTATPQFLSDENNPTDYDLPGQGDVNQWQQNFDGPWFATTNVELKNGKASIPLQLFDDNVVEGTEYIKWTISDSAPFGFKKTKYTFTEGDTTVEIPLSDGKKFSKNKTITIKIKDNDTVTDGASTATFDNDPLTGSAGVNPFVINSPSDEIDTITDFTRQEGDQLLVSARGFGGELAEGNLLAEQFTIGSTAVASDRFINDSSTGGLFFNVDGIGGLGQTQIASLSTSLLPSSNDIFVIA